jgi:hypothetical protein
MEQDPFDNEEDTFDQQRTQRINVSASPYYIPSAIRRSRNGKHRVDWVTVISYLAIFVAIPLLVIIIALL